MPVLFAECGRRGKGPPRSGAFHRQGRTSATLERREFFLCDARDAEDATEAKAAGTACDDEQTIRRIQRRARYAPRE